MEEINKNPEVLKLMKKYGKQYITILTKELIKAGKNNTGKLINSLQDDLKLVGKTIVLQLIAEKYLYNIDQGRKKGKYAPISELEKWCTLKNIPKSAAFAINQNIYKYGIKPTFVIDKANKKFENYIINKMESDLVPILENQIVKNFKEKK